MGHSKLRDMISHRFKLSVLDLPVIKNGAVTFGSLPTTKIFPLLISSPHKLWYACWGGLDGLQTWSLDYALQFGSSTFGRETKLKHSNYLNNIVEQDDW